MINTPSRAQVRFFRWSMMVLAVMVLAMVVASGFSGGVKLHNACTLTRAQRQQLNATTAWHWRHSSEHYR
jgi:hypothetical protein